LPALGALHECILALDKFAGAPQNSLQSEVAGDGEAVVGVWFLAETETMLFGSFQVRCFWGKTVSRHNEPDLTELDQLPGKRPHNYPVPAEAKHQTDHATSKKSHKRGNFQLHLNFWALDSLDLDNISYDNIHLHSPFS